MLGCLRCMINSTRRQNFARFRTGSRWLQVLQVLQVQVGRFQGTVRSHRFCEERSSQDMEDEEHCLLKCLHFEDIRDCSRGALHDGSKSLPGSIFQERPQEITWNA
jgi:hypothetical protein